MAKLGELGAIITGNTPKTSEPENYSSNDICFVKPSDISDNEITYLTISEYYISEIARNTARIVPPGSILVTCIGIIGKVAINQVECAFNQQINAIVPNGDKCLTEYLAYAVQWKKAKMQEIANAPVVPILNKTQFSEMEVKVPSLSEQRHVATVLNKVCNLIALRKQQLAKLDELVKARFVELFGDPVSNPMRWKKEQLQCNATLLNGRAYKQDELLDSGKYPVLRVGNFFSNRSWYYSDLELDDDKYCDNGDLLYAWSASFGPRIWSGGKVIYHYHIWKVLVGENYNKQFLCNLLDYVTASLMGETHGIGMMHLTKSGMEETEFIVPPMELQGQFATFVKQTDKSKLAIQQSLDKMELLKKALMQKYFG